MAWAGLVVLGDGNYRPAPQAAPFTSGRLARVGGLLGLLILAALLFAICRQFRQAWSAG
jgi:hypothetical protein